MLTVCVQVLTALERAHRELGFVHGDMRIANIMEHRPRDDAEAGDNEYVPRGFHTDGKLQSADEFKLPGADSFSNARCNQCQGGTEASS